MSYEVRCDTRVSQALRLLPELERKRVVSTVLSLADDPVPPGARQLPSPRRAFRLRDGRFDIHYVVDMETQTVTVYQVLKDNQLLNAAAYRVDA